MSLRQLSDALWSYHYPIIGSLATLVYHDDLTIHDLRSCEPMG